MNRTKRLLIVISSITAMLLLILDAETALQGAKYGIEIVLNTVVPTLFPFIYISSLINRAMIGRQVPVMRWLGKLCGIPHGAEFLLLLGFISGYPVGAKIITDCSSAGQLDRNSARRMLGFCNNAGPAFIFGILLPMFSKPIIVFLLWIVHILSAILTAVILPGRSSQNTVNVHEKTPESLRVLLLQAEKTVAEISGLVILFRILIAFLDKYLLWRLPLIMKVIICGILELSNGCIILREINCEAIRLIVSACMISMGGICVIMQTASVTKGIGTGMYLPGKVIQCAMSFLMITPVALFIYHDCSQSLRKFILWGMLICIEIIAITWILLQKNTRNLKKHSV